MQTTSNPNPTVQVRVLRVIWFGGQWRQPGDVIEWDYVNARGLESTHKGEIIQGAPPADQRDQVITDPAPAAPKKGSKP